VKRGAVSVDEKKRKSENNNNLNNLLGPRILLQIKIIIFLAF
jgi:hypothetical protein